MAFPFILESNFDLGTNAEWTSESDTGSLLDFPHFSELARIPGMPAPYKGGHCMRVVCGDTNTHMVVSTAIDIADAATASARWYMYVSPDFTATADDVFNIFELAQAGGGTVETTVGMRITAATNKLEIGIGDGTAPSTYATNDFPRGKWVGVEVTVKCSTTAVGTATLYVDGASVVALTSLTNGAAIGDGQLGTKATLSTTTGTILFDQFIFDDLRVYTESPSQRWNLNPLFTKSAQAFVGPGCVENAALYAGAGTDCVLQLWDTDRGDTTEYSRMVLETKNTANSESVDAAGLPLEFRRGCYVSITGTTPRAQLKIAPKYWGSAGLIRSFGARRQPERGNQ